VIIQARCNAGHPFMDTTPKTTETTSRRRRRWEFNARVSASRPGKLPENHPLFSEKLTNKERKELLRGREIVNEPSVLRAPPAFAVDWSKYAVVPPAPVQAAESAALFRRWNGRPRSYILRKLAEMNIYQLAKALRRFPFLRQIYPL